MTHMWYSDSCLLVNVPEYGIQAASKSSTKTLLRWTRGVDNRSS